MGKAWFALTALILAGACADTDESSESTPRQRAVAERGAAVMPFDLDRTTHVFDKRETGGLQRVVADVDDAEQVRLIREHLSEEAERFARGDFHDPSTIHGDDMPGLHELVSRAGDVSIEYREIEAGAEVMYSAEDPELVRAIHAWFDAQVDDHGVHAESGHGDDAHTP